MPTKTTRPSNIQLKNSDDYLVRAAQRGDCTAYAELFTRHRDRLFRFIFRITRNAHDAEDVLQDSWMKAFVHIESFDHRAAFFTWITRIAINSALMHLRKHRKISESSLDEQPCVDGFLTLDLTSTSQGPEQICLAKEQHELIEQVAHRLPPGLRTTFMLRYFRERSVDEIAAETGISVPAVKSRLVRARLSLRVRMRSQPALRQSFDWPLSAERENSKAGRVAFF